MMSDKKGESGSAGSIRAAGGSFAKMEIAHEEEYFYKQVSESTYSFILYSDLFSISSANNNSLN